MNAGAATKLLLTATPIRGGASAPARAPGEAPALVPGRRRHLTLVPTGPNVRRGGGRRWRLTRRGRLCGSLLVAAAIAAAALAMTASLGTPAPVGHVVTVRPGQTLSQLAEQNLPGLPNRQGVLQIQVANDLDSQQIHAGQTLRIPSVG